MFLSKTSLAFRMTLMGVLCVFTAAISGPLQGQVITTLPAGCEDPMINRECTNSNTITLLQPLDDETTELELSPEPLQVFFDYFNMSWPWVIGVASGIAVFQCVWGGIMIIYNADLEGGKDKIQWALGGMVMIALAGFILRFLNPIFYR